MKVRRRSEESLQIHTAWKTLNALDISVPCWRHFEWLWSVDYDVGKLADGDVDPRGFRNWLIWKGIEPVIYSGFICTTSSLQSFNLTFYILDEMKVDVFVFHWNEWWSHVRRGTAPHWDILKTSSLTDKADFKLIYSRHCTKRPLV